MCYLKRMRTTLALDDDVILAARAIADRDRKTIGAVVSELARQSLQRHAPGATTRNGLPLLPSRGKQGSVTLELVNRLRDEMP
jgi:hypothetical protein